MGVGEKTQEKILRAAEEVFIRYGFEGARMEQIAEQAGVLKANIYYYFKGKEELYQALIDSVLSSVFSEVSTLLQDKIMQEGTAWERLDAFLEVFFELVERYEGLVSLAFSEILHPPREDSARSDILVMLDQIEGFALVLIKQGMEEGVFSCEDAAQTLLTLEGIVYYYFLLPADRLEAVTRLPKFDREALQSRREHLRRVIRRILE